MLNEDVLKFIQERQLGDPNILNYLIDIDGPGKGGNRGIIASIEKPKEGGRLVYLYNYKYPYRGMAPTAEDIDKFYMIKKVYWCAILAFNNLPAKIWLGLLFILPRFLTEKLLCSVLNYFLWVQEWALQYQLLKPYRYCPTVRETYRVLILMAERVKKSSFKQKLLLLVRDFLCMILELDTAYKFRWYDIMAEAKKEELIRTDKRQVKEVKRLLGLLCQREISQKGMAEKFRRIGKYLILGLRFSKFLRKLVAEFFREADLEKIKPDEGDKYYLYLRMDYNFWGKDLTTRVEERKKIDGESWKYFENVANAFLADRQRWKDADKNTKVSFYDNRV